MLSECVIFPIEWKNSVQEGVDPARGAVVAVGGATCVAWIYDDIHVFVIPLDARRRAKVSAMHPVLRSGVRVIGHVSPEYKSAIAEAMQDELARQRAIVDWMGWDDDVTLDYAGVRLPAFVDGWQPISMADGSYWKFPSRNGAAGHE